ncbi:MAG: hypothetical protein WDM87_16920 [Terracidiphilus sp.]
MTSRTRRRCVASEVGYSLRVGGGLSNEPHLAVKLDAFVRPDQAIRVARGVTEIFRDQQVLRESRRPGATEVPVHARRVDGGALS